MAYNIPFTDEANKGTITVEDNAINTETSLLLPGRNLRDYGTSLLTNALHLMENFADVNPPNNPVEGQLWYDTTNGIDQLKIYDGTNWVAAGGLKKGQSEPEAANSVVGDLWVDTSNSQLYLYTGSGWVLVGPTYSTGNKTGALPEIVVDTSDVSRDVIVNYVNNIPVSIVSAVEFTPKSTLSGFSKVYVGLTLSTNVSGNIAKLRGEAKTAERLNVNPADTTNIPGTILASALARKDPGAGTQIFNNTIKLPNNGLEVGNVKTFSVLVEGTSGILELAGAGTLDVRTPVSTNPVVRIANNGNFGINNLGPTEKLDLKGNINIGVEDGDDPALDTSGKLTVRSEFDSISPSSGALSVKGGAGIAKQLRVGSTTTLEDTLTVANKTGSILPPSVTNTATIGNSSIKFSGIYANNFYGSVNGNVTGDVTGNITGSASKLNSPTTFQMTGDVSSSGFTFDGQTGGSTKTFTTTLAASFINTKSDITTTLGRLIGSDEVIINRPTADVVGIDPTGSTGVYKTTVNDITANIPTLPIGSLIMYGGLTAPTGWFLCDGSEVSLSTYGALATALGYSAVDATTWYWGNPSSPTTLFRIPDYRGRMPLGIGLPGGANRISNSAAGQMGGVAGTEDVTLIQNNLPEHQHDLQSSTGEQFYGVTNATTSAPETLSGGGIDGGTGSRLGLSGGIYDGTTNAPVDITNPFAAINFIIYHGVT
jgi:microcystin-dependent protein